MLERAEEQTTKEELMADFLFAEGIQYHQHNNIIPVGQLLASLFIK